MRVIRRFGNKLDRQDTDPLLESNGFWWELRAGDICHPTGIGNWFSEPHFKSSWKWFCKFPILPFISWKIGRKGGYFGFKIYGVDSNTYKQWAGNENVYPGSKAMHFSVRPFATIN